MKRTVKNLLAIAHQEIGYCEKNSNANLDSKTANAGDGNYTKYARDLAQAGYYQASKQGYQWCDVFVDWCFLQLAGSKVDAEAMQSQTGLYGAGCDWSARYFKEAGRYDETNPQAGDQIFFRNYSHTGIIEKVENGYIYTIEGNTGNCVKDHVYAIGDSYVKGFGHPFYEEEEADPAPSAPQNDCLQKGDVVTIKPGARFWGGAPVSGWLLKKEWILEETPTSKRAVINKSVDGANAIMSPISTDYLVKKGSETNAPSESVYPDAKIDFAMNFDSSAAGGYTPTEPTYLRAGASDKKKAVKSLDIGAELRCYGYHTGDWLFVACGTKTGFVHNSCVTRA